MTTYYNEIDPFAAEWLRNLIAAGHIAPGEVDKRSIVEVMPEDLRDFDQCHFFAGIGVWSYALRLAGWSDDRPVWTGSCPCQPFSSAGKQKGTDDERHLWPHFFRLIQKCRPPVVFGEQVARKAGLAWLDAVSADLEGAGYAIGAADLSACGVGAPHLRQRLYFVADDGGEGLEEFGREPGDAAAEQSPAERDCKADELADTERRWSRERRSGEASRRTTIELDRHGADNELGNPCSPTRQQKCEGSLGHETTHGKTRRDKLESHGIDRYSSASKSGALANPNRRRQSEHTKQYSPQEDDSSNRDSRGRHAGGRSDVHGPGPVGGFWSPANWVLCRDPKGPRWRPIEPGTKPLAHGTFNRVGRLRGYGNAIVAPLAAEFIAAYMECRP